MDQRNCIFCPRQAEEYEHVIPKWMPRHLELERQIMSHDVARGVSRTRHARVDAFKAKITCGDCHDFITDHIETPAAGLLKALMIGEARLLDVEEQRLLAAWGAKTAITFWGQTRRRQGVPVAHRRYLIERGRAHPAVFVALAQTEGTYVRAALGRKQIPLAGMGAKLHVYHFALAFGTIGIVVYGPGDGRQRLEYKDLTTLAVRVSPERKSARRWPPGRILDWDAFTAFRDFDFRASA